MPTYTMMCFKLPISLCKKIQSIFTQFWWDNNSDRRIMCWVSWKKLTFPKNAGGLGFRDMETFNDALLAKQSWRILKHPSSLLSRVLLGKYCSSQSFMECSSPSQPSHGWKSILAGREIIKKGCRWIIGSGEKIKYLVPTLAFVRCSVTTIWSTNLGLKRLDRLSSYRR